MRSFLNLILTGFIVNLVMTPLILGILFGPTARFILFIVPINILISVFVIAKNKKLKCSNLGPILAIIAVAFLSASLIFTYVFNSIPLLWDTRVGLILIILGVSLFFNMASAIAYFRLYHKMKKR